MMMAGVDGSLIPHLAHMLCKSFFWKTTANLLLAGCWWLWRERKKLCHQLASAAASDCEVPEWRKLPIAVDYLENISASARAFDFFEKRSEYFSQFKSPGVCIVIFFRFSASPKWPPVDIAALRTCNKSRNTWTCYQVVLCPLDRSR